MPSSYIAYNHHPTSRLTKSINDLPNELLCIIFEYLVPNSLKHVPRASHPFRILDTLSRVSRRFRGIALAFLRRDIVCSSFSQVERIVDLLSWDRALDDDAQSIDGQMNRQIESRVRTIQIGRPRYSWHYPRIPTLRNGERTRICHFYGYPSPFRQLTSFECFNMICSPSIVQSLRHCRGLKNLVLAWDDAASFPAIQHLPSVDTLRLYLFQSGNEDRSLRRLRHPSDELPPFPSLATLALYDCFSHSRVMEQCTQLSFPNLRVLTMKSTRVDVCRVFDFIQRHPTILEANIHFHIDYDLRALRLEALVKLIEGTGTWIIPAGASAVRDEPRASAVSEDDVIFPQPFDKDYGDFYRFAFSRTPCSPGALEWRSSIGSPEPRYHCTGLAVYFLEDEEDGADDRDSVDTFVQHMRQYLPRVQELRVMSRASLQNICDFEMLMDDLITGMQDWAHLRKFTFYAPLPRNRFFWEPTRSTKYGWTCNVYQERTFFLDFPSPLFYWDMELTTINNIILFYRSEHDEKFQDLTRKIREALRLDADAALDYDDPQLLMRAWEAHNYRRVAENVCRLARACPRLEQFDWYVSDDAEERLLWRWKILRDADASVRLVYGLLSWTDSVRGEVPPFPVYVGQELRHTHRDYEDAYW